MKHELMFVLDVSAVPVLPATLTPSTAAALPVPLWTTSSMACLTLSAVPELMA